MTVFRGFIVEIESWV